MRSRIDKLPKAYKTLLACQKGYGLDFKRHTVRKMRQQAPFALSTSAPTGACLRQGPCVALARARSGRAPRKLGLCPPPAMQAFVTYKLAPVSEPCMPTRPPLAAVAAWAAGAGMAAALGVVVAVYGTMAWPLICGLLAVCAALNVSHFIDALLRYQSAGNPLAPEAHRVKLCQNQMPKTFDHDCKSWLNPYLHSRAELLNYEVAQIASMGHFGGAAIQGTWCARQLGRGICVWAQDGPRFTPIFRQPGTDSSQAWAHIVRQGYHFRTFLPQDGHAADGAPPSTRLMGEAVEAGGGGDCLFYAIFRAVHQRNATPAEVAALRVQAADAISRADDSHALFHNETVSAFTDFCARHGVKVVRA